MSLTKSHISPWFWPTPLVMIDDRSVEILDELGWDNLETRRKRQLATIMFKLKNQIVPDHLAQIFNSTNSMYSYNLRNSTHNLFVARPYTKAGKRSFRY